MKPYLPIALLSFVAFAACGGDEGHTHPPGDPKAHGSGEQGHGHGTAQALGELKLGEHTVKVAQEEAVAAGKEVGIDVVFAKGQALPTVRAWIGIESAVGSTKTKLGKEGESTLHGHVEAPKPLPAGSALWLEVEAADGAKKASIAFRQ